MNLDIDSLLAINTSITDVVNKISLSLLILLTGFIIGKLAERFLVLILRNSSLRHIKIFSININAEKLIPVLISYVFYIAGIVLALIYSRIFDIVILIISLIFSIAVLFSIFYAIKELIPNFSARLQLSRISNFKLRKRIKIDNVLGEITGINYSEIKITTESGDEIHIPCKVFLKKEYELLK